MIHQSILLLAGKLLLVSKPALTAAVLLSIAALVPVLAAAQSGRAAAGEQDEARRAEQKNEQIITRAFERWAAGQAGFFEEVLAPDVVWTIEGSGPAARSYDGRDAFIEEAAKPFTARLAEPLRPSVRHIYADEDRVVVVWDGRAVAADGEPYRNSYVWIFTMAGGQATDVTAFLDLQAYYDVLERVPLPSENDPEND